MTLEQGKKKILDAQSQITNLQREITDTKRRLIEECCPFKVGQKVRLVFPERRWGDRVEAAQSSEQYISHISVDSKGEFAYKFNKPKKDGTMGGQSAGIYSWDNYKVEAI